jgi:predicted XRE-type DNA-binding protein
MPSNTDDERFETGSGNVFADLGLPDPDMALKKAELAAKIAERIAANGWSQTKAAAVMDVDQPKVSAIIRGRLKDFSLERLIICLERLGQPVGLVFLNVIAKQPNGKRVPSRPKSSGAIRPLRRRGKVGIGK